MLRSKMKFVLALGISAWCLVGCQKGVSTVVPEPGGGGEGDCRWEGVQSPSDVGTQWYVTPDSAAVNGTGTRTSPFNSIAAGLAVAQPGDSVVLLDGTFNLGGALTFPTGGTEGRPISLRGDPEGSAKPILHCTNNPAASRGLDITRPWIVVEGLEIENCGGDGIRIDGDVNGSNDGREYGLMYDYYLANPARPYRVNGADHVTIRNNYIHEVDGDGIKVSRTNHTEIVSNRIYRAGRNGTGQGIDFLAIRDSKVAFNEIWDSATPGYVTDVGMFAKGGSDNILIENNYVHDLAQNQYCLMAGQDTEGYNTRYVPAAVSAEFHREMTQCAFSGCVSCAADKCVGDPAVRDPYFVINYGAWYVNSTMSEGRNITFRGNVLSNCNLAFGIWNAWNTKIHSNTLINSAVISAPFITRSDGLNSANSGPLGQFAAHIPEELRVYGNLIFNAADTVGGSGGVFYNLSNGFVGGTLHGDHNLVFGTNTLSGSFLFSQDVHSVFNVNPLLDSAGRPISGSPAIGMVTSLRSSGVLGTDETWKDRNCNLRPNADGTDDAGALLH